MTVHIAGKQPDILYFDVLFGAWIVFQALWNGSLPSLSDWVVRIGAVCVLSGLLSTLVNSRDMYRGLAATKALAVGVLVFAVVRRAPLGLLTPALFGACASILLLRDYQNMQYSNYGALSGLKDEIEIAMGRSNYVASILILLIPLAAAGACLDKGKKRWVFIACAMLMCAGLLVTMSRGAILAIVGATILSLPFLRRAGLKIKHGVVALTALCVTVAIVPTDLLETNIALFAYRLENPDYTRQEIMQASWEAFAENPVLGVGPGQLGDAINHHMMVPTIAGDRQYNGHNLIIDSLAEMGLPTGLALLAMVGVVLRRAWVSVVTRATALNVAVWIALLASVLHNMVEASFEGPHFQVAFWAVAAMAGSQSVVDGAVATRGPVSAYGSSPAS
ncbi:MAG: O-antigen ligase family protein [Candidatus Sulfotelmatobacter sp.]